MFSLIDKSVISDHSHNGHTLKTLELKMEEFDNLVVELIDLVPDYYVDPESIAGTLERLGKSATAKKLRTKIPQAKKIRSGDIGEVLTTEYIKEVTEYSVPILKLRWSDHPNMAMRGDDVIGILVDQERQTIHFLKAEAKSNQSLSRNVLQQARDELDLNDGFPAPHALGFIADRLRETEQSELANLIEKVQLVDGIRTDQVKHLLFTFTASNPATLQKEALEAYDGEITQDSVGFRVSNHQELITAVYEGVLNGLDG